MIIPTWAPNHTIEPHNISLRRHRDDTGERMSIVDLSLQVTLYTGDPVDCYLELRPYCTQMELEAIFGVQAFDIQEYLDSRLPEVESEEAEEAENEVWSIYGEWSDDIE